MVVGLDRFVQSPNADPAIVILGLRLEPALHQPNALTPSQPSAPALRTESERSGDVARWPPLLATQAFAPRLIAGPATGQELGQAGSPRC
jgi:hypothetical protein